MLPIYAADPAGPEYTADGRLKFPANYREWVFLSTGIGMTYGPLAQQGQFGPPIFDNIFVNPEAYRAFLKTGRWPDKTILVMEARHSESHASINNGGHFQTDLVGIEAEVKDSSTAEGPWNFYGFQMKPGQPVEGAKAVPHTAGCYGCHGVQTAVENTFVQFYPPLYDAAERLGTFNPGFKPLPINQTKLIERIRNTGWKNTVVALDEAAKNAPDATIMNVEVLNQTAYRLMSLDVVGDAMSLLQWASRSFPKSANIQDSLSEAAEKYGAAWVARPAAELALKLLPDDKTLADARRERVFKAVQERLARLPDRTKQKFPRIEVHAGLPAVSPDGARIAFVGDRDGASNLYVVNADGGGETQITNDKERKSLPKWDANGRVTTTPRGPLPSPDGKQVLMGDGRLYVAEADGSNARPITTGAGTETPMWSPDGKRIAFARFHAGIWVMNADGTEQRRLATIAEDEGTPEWPRWSPDGKRIAVQVGSYSPERMTAHVWVVDATSGEAHKLAPHAEAYLDETPSWFPDGKRIAFQSSRTGRMEIWVMGADGSGARQVTK
jgi:hypothetical protein